MPAHSDKAKAYRRNADVCRRLADNDGPHREAYQKLAEIWETLATEQEANSNEPDR